jgi:hypothetical protein
MQGAAPTHAEVQPHPSRTPIIAAIAALVVGGAIATGVWWLTDNDVDILPQADSATRVIVSPTVQPGAGTAVKNEAVTAAAVGVAPVNAPGTDVAPGSGTAAKNEAGAAAAVGTQYGTSQYRAEAGAGTAAKDEAGSAAAIGLKGSKAQDVNPSTGQATPAERQSGPGANTD